MDRCLPYDSSAQRFFCEWDDGKKNPIADDHPQVGYYVIRTMPLSRWKKIRQVAELRNPWWTYRHDEVLETV